MNNIKNRSEILAAIKKANEDFYDPIYVGVIDDNKDRNWTFFDGSPAIDLIFDWNSDYYGGQVSVITNHTLYDYFGKFQHRNLCQVSNWSC